MYRKSLLSMTLVVCLFLGFTAGVLTAGEAPEEKEELVVGISGRMMSFDPADHRNRFTETVIRNMFDGLVTRTIKNEVVLELAESATLIDPTTWEFVLKKGVTFHNGEPLTAEDVKFTFDRIINEGGIEYPEPHTSQRKGLTGPLTSVELIDDYTIRFHLSDPWPPALQMIVHQQIVPKDYLEEVGTKGFIEHPVGSGPFKFIEGKLDEMIVMERFEDYYGGADDLSPVGPAFLDRVIFQVIPEDSTRVAALQAGEVDIIQGVQPHMIPILEADPNISVKTCAGTRPFWIEMNPNKPPFNDVQVRQALNYAVNVDLLIEKVLGGRGIALPGALSPFNNFADATLKPYGYNPDKAKALLAEAGWTDTDGDGILDKDGQPFAFVIDAQAGKKERAEAVMGQLREVGINASVRVWDYAVLKPLLLNGDRMAYVGDWGDSAFDPVGHFEAKWHTHIKGSPYGRGNFSSYSNPRVDELIEMGEVTADVARRHKIYDEAQRIIYEEAPAIFLFLPEEVEACSVRVQNWEPSPDSRINLHDVRLSK